MKRVIFNDSFINVLIKESALNRMKQPVSHKALMKIDNTNCYYFLEYKPTSKHKHTTDKVKKERHEIWIFKDNNGENQTQYDKIYKVYMKKVADFLVKNYSTELRNLTFVCVPASTEEDTQNRWKEFSTELCERVGMINGFDHIHVIGNAVPSHYGGGGKTKVKYDEAFFKNKRVILFDDIINTGYSMSRYKEELENLGAKVVQFLAIAKTV